MNVFPQYYANIVRNSFYRFDDINSVIKVASFSGATLNDLTISFVYDPPDGYYHGICHTCEPIDGHEFNRKFEEVAKEQHFRALRLNIIQ